MCERAGNASTVGSVGAMMGGGVGFLARWIGLSIDSLLSASIVLATGELVVATREGEHSDLFWAIRGGGSNFGVIVDFTLTAIRLGWDDSNGHAWPRGLPVPCLPVPWLPPAVQQ